MSTDDEKRFLSPSVSVTRKQRGKVDRSAMFPVAPTIVDLPADYFDWLTELKQRIVSERLRAILASNSAMVLLYWDIGNRILDK